MSGRDQRPLVADGSARARVTVAFLASGFTSHVYSSLGLARRLTSRGMNVEYWGDHRIRRLVVSQGFSWHGVPPMRCYYEPLLPRGPFAWFRNPSACLRSLRVARDRRRSLSASLDEFERRLDAQLATRHPALVLIDPLTTAYVPLLQRRGIRCVLLQDKPWPARDSNVPPPNSGILPRETLTARTTIRLRWALEHVCVGCRDLGNALLALLGCYTCELLLPAILARSGHERAVQPARRRVRYELYLAGLEEWILGAPAMDFRRSAPMPARVRFIGPCPDLDRLHGPPGFEALGATRLVYVSMGVSVPYFYADLALLRRVIAALEPIPHVQVFVSVGDLKTWSALRVSSSKVRVVPFLPQIAILRHAALAITHAGANTFRECIATGTPMLAFPRDFDQHGNAARIEHLGIGLRGSRRRETAHSVRRKIVRLLDDPRFKERVGSLNELLSNCDSDLLTPALSDVLESHAAN
jgi:UDP:flavonoid glycosyltransferase YjiC (YdhE family)